MIVKKFKNLSKKDVDIAGGKGASLGEMYSSGIPVPNGFVVLSHAFNEFTSKTGLISEIESELDKVDINNVETVEKASETIRSTILLKEFPEEFKQKIFDEFEDLNAEFVAVRSSATSEDSSDAAWAGQLDTFLNTTKESLLENIKKCWASLFTPRAIFYRFEKKLNKTDVSVAVVVQKMVASEISGIAFSVHPITEDYNQVLIEAGMGLGEAIVSGQITPDNYVIRKDELEIENKNVSEQNRAMFRRETGGVEWGDVRAHSQKLSDELIIKLSEIIIQIENHYDFPCDIEWAYAEEELYITQSRPITTLSSDVMPKKKEIDLYKGNKINIVEQFKKSTGTDQIFTLRGHYIPLFMMTDWLRFYNKDFNTKNEGVYPTLSIKKDGTFIHHLNLNKYLEVSREGVRRYIDSNNFKEETTNRYKKIKSIINNFYEKNILQEQHTEKQLLEILKEAESNLHEVVALTLFIDFLDSKTLEEIYKENKINIDFDKIYETSEINDFKSYDLKSNIEIVKWINTDKKYLTHIYTGYSSAPTPKEVEKKLSEINAEEIKEDIAKSKNILDNNSKTKKELYNKLNTEEQSVVNFLSWISAVRDDRKILMNKMNAIMIKSVRKLYEIWNIDQKHALNSYAFEVLKGKEFIETKLDNIKKREGDFVNSYFGGENYLEQNTNLEELFKEAQTLEEPRNDSKKIHGQTANKGYVKGFVKIILDPKKNHSFMHGEILVTGMTRPEFVPLMKKASAVITNEGGIACHAAIVSRELNKPCIIGTKNATEILRDGDYVEVDADTGVVKILETKEVPKYEQLLHHHFPLIIAELTDYGETIRDLKWSDKRFEHDPYCVFEIRNGFLHYLYDMKGVEWKIEQAGKFDKKIMKKKVLEGYNAMKETILNEKALNKEEFLKFIDHLKSFWTWWDLMWFMIEYYDQNKLPLDDLIAIRKETEYMAPGFAGTIRNSLKKIFPGKEELVDGISLQDLENGLPSDEALQKRINHCLYTNGKFYESREEIEKEYDIKFVDQDLNHDGELAGQTTYKGKAKGTVKIVEKREDIKKFNKGDILVASTTTPDLLPAMKIAGAILSEHGGAICHAAITSRELKKPCVVGIKGLTKILKNGMIVEVNADEGIVKIIEKK